MKTVQEINEELLSLYAEMIKEQKEQIKLLETMIERQQKFLDSLK